MKRWACLLVLSSCGPAVQVGHDATPRDGGIDEFTDAAPPQACEKMDILFVIDDSGSMEEEQVNLAQNFPQFAAVIDNYVTRSNALLDYRIGVTTTSRTGLSLSGIPIPEPGNNGTLLMTNGCNMPRRWVQRTDPNVVQAFSCVAQVGTFGSGFEMPLLMIDWALDERVLDGTNTGFVRADALLAIVILTDEDDCSRSDTDFALDLLDVCDRSRPQMIPVPDYLTFLDTVKGGRGRWAAAVIAGPTDCSSGFGNAVAAIRLQDFVAEAGQNAVFSSICEGDLTLGLEDALNTFDAACQTFPPIE